MCCKKQRDKNSHQIYATLGLIKALESKIIKFEPRIRNVIAPLPLKGTSSQCQYEIIMDINSFDDEISQVSVNFPCLE
jgi:hypothetical protein